MSAKVPKVLLFTLDYLPNYGGVATYVDGIASAFPNGYAAVLTDSGLLNGKPAPKRAHHVFYKQLLSSKYTPRWKPAFAALLSTLREFNADVIICANILPLGVVTYAIAKITGKKFYISLHGLDLQLAQQSARKKKLARHVLKRSNLIIVNSNYTKEITKKFLGRKCPPVVVLYPCPSGKPMLQNKDAVRALHHYNHDEIVLLSVGRLVRRKGFDKVITALPNILRFVHDIRYVIIGDGPDYAHLSELIDRLRLHSVVTLKKSVGSDELAGYYSMADIFVMPNVTIGPDVEGFGLVFLEASQYKLPAIAGNSGGAPEAVIDGKTGLVVDTNEPEALEMAIIKLAKHPDLRESLGRKGEQRVSEQFSWQHEINKLVFAYNNV